LRYQTTQQPSAWTAPSKSTMKPDVCITGKDSSIEVEGN